MALGFRSVLCDPFQMSLVRKNNDPDQSSNRFTGLLRKFPYRIQLTQSEKGLCTGFCHTEHKVSKYPRVVSPCEICVTVHGYDFFLFLGLHLWMQGLAEECRACKDADDAWGMSFFVTGPL